MSKRREEQTEELVEEQTEELVEEQTEELVEMIKDGEVIAVCPAQVEPHRRLGWKTQ